MQKLFVFVDDSGHLHRNEDCGWFVYAGYIFNSRETLEVSKRKYVNANRKIKTATGRSDELKAYGLSLIHRRALFNSIRECESFSAAVEICRLRDTILDDKKSICRYKDYMLKRALKHKLQELIGRGRVSRSSATELFFNIDEQLTATDGYYNLESSILEEFRYGIRNWDYGTTHPNLFDNTLTVNLKYCESKNNYLVQASDILANRIWSSYRTGNESLLNIPNHTHLILP